MRLMIFLFVAGLVLIFKGCQEAKLNDLAESLPQTIALTDLESSGYGDNAHVVVSDFLFLEWDFVYSERRGKWSEAWVPAVPLGSPFHQKLDLIYDEDGNWPDGVEMPVPESIRTIVKMPDARSAEDISELGAQDTFQGLVVNEIEKLGSEERGILASSYPGVDFTQCVIIEIGRAPQGGMLVLIFMAGGLLCIGGGGYMAWRAFQARPSAKRTRRKAAREGRRQTRI